MRKKKRKHGDLTRREFLYVAMGGSAALMGVGTCGAAAWALQSHPRFGVELFSIDPPTLPPPDTTPLLVPEGFFWLTNTSAGLYALCNVCPHMGAQMRWVKTEKKFVCPAHGQESTLAGHYVQGPGYGINLFKFNIEVRTPYSIRRTNNQPLPIDITDAINIVVDVRKKIFG